MQNMIRNVLGTQLQECSTNPLTGFYRDGHCRTGPDDFGSHIVAVVMTDEFLQFSKEKGNDLSTPSPQYGFPGLKAGDNWCLCASRWAEAMQMNKAPKIRLEATHQKMLQWFPLEVLKAFEYTPQNP